VNPRNLTANEDGVVVGDVSRIACGGTRHLQKGDVIRKFNGRDLRIPGASVTGCAGGVNKKIEVKVMRDGKPLKVSAELRERPEFSNRASHPPAWTTKSQHPLPQPMRRNDTGSDEMKAMRTRSVPCGSVIAPDLAKRLDLPTGVTEYS